MSADDLAETLEALCEMGLIEAFQLKDEDEPRYMPAATSQLVE